jgi:hypothetical protein
VDVAGGPAPNDATLRVHIAKDGRLAIDGQNLDDARQLTERVRASFRVRPDLTAVVLGHRDAPFAYVLSAVESIKQGGVTRIGFSFDASPPPTATAPATRSVPSLQEGASWKCEIRQHVENLEKITVFLAIHVGPDGAPQTVEVLDDPGHGLGELAKSCAYQQKFRPAVDANGNPAPGTFKIHVGFQGHH